MKILICDGDLNFTTSCKNVLLSLAQKHEVNIVVQTVSSGKELLFYEETKYKNFDLIYLDYNLKELDGMETARELRKRGYLGDIVFCATDGANSIDGYDVDALYFFVKSQFTSAKFEEIFYKAVQRYRTRQTETISFSAYGQQINVMVQDILYFDVQKRLVTVHYYKENKVCLFTFYSTLSKLEDSLLDKGFIRIHASYLISEKYIFNATSNQIKMYNGDIVPVGRAYKEAFFLLKSRL